MFESPHILVYLGLLLVCSQIAGRIAGLICVPRVVGYLVVGIALGPSMTGLLDQELVQTRLVLINEVALAIIAFSIGGSLKLKEVKQLGGPLFGITTAQAFGAVIVVAVSLLAYGEWNGWNDANGDVPLFIPMVLIVAAVSAATAPAAIMGIVHEYRARGPLTTVLLGVVALDDGLTILIYSFALTAAQAMLGISAEFSWQSALMVPAREIGLAVGLGVAAGFSLSFATRWFTQRTSLLAIVLGVILFLSGCAISLHVSALLANMVLGFVVVNCLSHSEDLFSRVEAIEEPIFGLFFSLAGAHLDLALLTTTGGLAVVITLARFGGKLLGAQIAASLLKAPRTVRRYLGLTLLPQAGVTIGLILHARGQLVVAMGNDENLKAELGYLDFFVNAVLASVVINELITPFLLRFASMQSGDANHQSKGLSDELA